MEYLSQAFERIVAFLPDLLAGLVVLAVGWIVAIGLGRLVRAVLPKVGFDRFLSRHGLERHRRDRNGKVVERTEGSKILGSLTTWAVFLVALMEAAEIWRLDFVASGLASLLAYVPNIIAAAVIFGAAYVIGNWVADRLRASSEEREQYSSILPSAVRIGILTLGAFLALDQLIIAPDIVFLAFAFTLGAVALAVALAFGLGARDAAGRMARDWYERNMRPDEGSATSPSPRSRMTEDTQGPGLH